MSCQVCSFSRFATNKNVPTNNGFEPSPSASDIMRFRRWFLISGQELARRLLEPFVRPLQQELHRIRLELRELPSNPLLAHGQRHFSQNDEDGILLEILRRIGIVEPSAFV